MDIPAQEFFFFTGKWSIELDDVLLASAVRTKEKILVEGSGIPESAMDMAGAKIYADFGVTITQSEMKEREQLLETRFRTFNSVVTTPGVAWIPKTKDVIAQDRVWLQILETNPFAAAYYHQDEPEFSRLAIIFGPTDVKIEASSELKDVIQKEIVILSDTTDTRRNVINISDSDSPFSEEVNSPANLVCEKVRRKLFDGEEEEASDHESSNRPPTFCYVPGLNGKPIRKMLLTRKLPVHVHVPSPNSSPGGSSQASNNPFPLTDHIGS